MERKSGVRMRPCTVSSSRAAGSTTPVRSYQVGCPQRYSEQGSNQASTPRLGPVRSERASIPKLVSESSQSHIPNQPLSECTFKPLQDPSPDALWRIIEQHKVLKAKMQSQEEAIQAIFSAPYYQVSKGPVLRAVSGRGNRSSLSVGRRRAKSTLPREATSSRDPRPENWAGLNPSSAVDSELNLVRNSRKRVSLQQGNLDSVGKSMFLYPAPDGGFNMQKAAFPAFGSPESVSKGNKSARRPQDSHVFHFPKDIFPILIRRRQTLE